MKRYLGIMVTAAALLLAGPAWGNPSASRPPPPDGHGRFDVDLPANLEERVREHREARRELESAFRARVRELDNPTEAEIEQLRQEFLAENADELAALREEGAIIRESVRLLRESQGGLKRPDDERPALSGTLAQKRAELRQRRQELARRLESLREDLRGKSREEVEAALEQFRTEREEQLESIRLLRQEIRERMMDDLEGPRRPDDGV